MLVSSLKFLALLMMSLKFAGPPETTRHALLNENLPRPLDKYILQRKRSHQDVYKRVLQIFATRTTAYLVRGQMVAIKYGDSGSSDPGDDVDSYGHLPIATHWRGVGTFS